MYEIALSDVSKSHKRCMSENNDKIYDLSIGRNSKSDTIPIRLGQSRVKISRVLSLKQIHLLVTPKIQEDTVNMFSSSIDLPPLMRRKRPSERSSDLGSLVGLREAYDSSLEQSGKLNHSLSRLQMERNENHFLFEQAVSLAEQLTKENKDLEDELEKQKTIASVLKGELKLMKERNIILVEELEEMKVEQTLMLNTNKELTKFNVQAKEEISGQELLFSKIMSDHEVARNEWDVNVQEKIEKLANNLKTERALRREEKTLWDESEEKLKNTEKRLEESGREVRRLKQSLGDLVNKLDEETTRLSEEIVRLCSEKAFQNMNYNALAQHCRAMETQLSETNDILQFDAHIPSVEEKGMFSGPSLAEQVELFPTNNFFRRNLNGPDIKSTGSLLGSEIDEVNSPTANESIASPPLAEIYTYLYITGTAIKLHFPDLDFVKIETLIDHVKNSPFYLYYDLMMVYMQGIMQEKAVDDVENSRKTLSPSRARHTSLLARFKHLNMGRKSAKKKRLSMGGLNLVSSSFTRASQYQNEDNSLLDRRSKINKSEMVVVPECFSKRSGGNRRWSTQVMI